MWKHDKQLQEYLWVKTNCSQSTRNNLTSTKYSTKSRIHQKCTNSKITSVPTSKEVLYVTNRDILMEGSKNVTVESTKLKCDVTGHRQLHRIPYFLNIHLSVPVEGRPNRPRTFLKSIVTGHRTPNPPPIPQQTITRSTLGSLGYTPMLQYGCLV